VHLAGLLAPLAIDEMPLVALPPRVPSSMLLRQAGIPFLTRRSLVALFVSTRRATTTLWQRITRRPFDLWLIKQSARPCDDAWNRAGDFPDSGRLNWEIQNAHLRHRRYVLAGAVAPYQPRPRDLRMTRTPDAPDGVIVCALKASGFGFETVSALIECGLVDARLQRTHPGVGVMRRRTNEKAK
jgi:hypothetical protein